MCESCDFTRLPRRDFIQIAGLVGATGGMRTIASQAALLSSQDVVRPPREKKPPRVWAVFLYPPADVVLAGKMEDSWARHQWFTWPGNQFQPEAQQAKFTTIIEKMAKDLNIDMVIQPEAIYQKAKIEEFIAQAQAAELDAVLVINFWNTLSTAAARIATEAAPTAIVYHPVGSNHQLPPKSLLNADGIYYIHSIENFAEIERGLRAVRAKKMLSQSRLLRIAGAVTELTQSQEPTLGTEIVAIPAAEFNALFDSIADSAQLQEEAAAFRQMATKVVDVSDEAFVDAIRAHHAVQEIMRRYGADAITIECLMLKHRKPCYSFAWHNGHLTPCGCENHLEATLTLMLGRWLIDRGGFQHNPEFDTSENLYFGAHCTCAWKLHGPQGPSQEFFIRPFFHQLPKTPALDVQWSPGEPVILAKYLTGKNSLVCWRGKVINSPPTPPTGGCATRVLVELEGLGDVCQAYSGPHPVLFCGDRGDARCFTAFAKICRLELVGNV
ncbi:MAG: hypothetical protein ACUVQR_03845 [Thermogutta sp.]